MNWRNVLIVALVAVPLVALLALGFGRDPRALPSALPGKSAPGCALAAYDGNPQSLPLADGLPLLVNFWSTWCVPCAAEHDLLQQRARTLEGRMRFVGVLFEDQAEAAQRYLEERGSTYAQLADPRSRCAIDYGVAGVPETFFIDGRGIVRHKEAGPLNAETLDFWIARILEPTP